MLQLNNCSFLGVNMKHRGFTLLELLITIAILAILVTLSFAGNTDLNEKTRAESFMLELKRHITFARAKATTSDEIVILCPVDATKLAANENLTCINNWKNNQIISFIDKNKVRNLKIVVDAGNGMAGKMIPLIYKNLDVKIIPLYFNRIIIEIIYFIVVIYIFD